MGGIFGFDATSNKTTQNTVNQQATSQYGDVTGGTSDSSIGSKGAGIGARSKVTAGKGGNVGIHIENTTLDAELAKAALNENSSLAIASLQKMQDLSTLSVGYAQANATNALLTLQQLGQNAQVIQAGGTAADVLDSAATSPAQSSATFRFSKPVIILAVGAVALIGFLAIRKHI